MNNITEVKLCIARVLLPHTECFDWKSFGDRGSPCYNPECFSDPQELYQDAITRAAVLVAMPKGSKAHLRLGTKMAESLGCKYVTYDWLVKVVGRLLSGTSYSELREMAILSSAIQNGMKAKGLKQIDSIQEALS